MHRVGGAVAVLATVFVVAGCGSLAPDESAAAAAATAFRAALQRSDGAAACALLSPETVHAVSQSAGKGCPQAIVEEHLGGTGRPVRIDAYGQNARVVFGDDTVFLADFPRGWRLIAAGCTPRGARPYDCLVKGS
jgi:hypothetical protein